MRAAATEERGWFGIMKLLAKPISSPGRAEKFPPPLMRFLRSNVGSRSRGRSRSSPLFFRRKNTAIETQEPSSPKVTCMGQVRVRRSKKSGKTPARPHRNGPPTRRRFKWIRNALFCRHVGCKLKKKKAFRPSWRKWVFSFHWCSLRKPKFKEASSRIESNLGSKIEASVRDADEETDEDYEEESKVFASSPSSPPKNALLLTRCRSAPYRSSSLAGRFWGSPLSTEETKPEPDEPEETRTEPENRESDNPTLEREFISRDSNQESKTDPETEEKSGFLDQFEENLAESANSEEPKAEQVSTIRPLILTRCKTVPARTAAKLDPDLTFWKKGRMGFHVIDSSSSLFPSGFSNQV